MVLGTSICHKLVYLHVTRCAVQLSRECATVPECWDRHRIGRENQMEMEMDIDNIVKI